MAEELAYPYGKEFKRPAAPRLETFKASECVTLLVSAHPDQGKRFRKGGVYRVVELSVAAFQYGKYSVGVENADGQTAHFPSKYLCRVAPTLLLTGRTK